MRPVMACGQNARKRLSRGNEPLPGAWAREVLTGDRSGHLSSFCLRFPVQRGQKRVAHGRERREPGQRVAGEAEHIGAPRQPGQHHRMTWSHLH